LSPMGHDIKPIFLDPLKKHHLEMMLADSEKPFLNRIYQLTLGVPRLITFVLTYMHNKKFKELNARDIIEFIEGNSNDEKRPELFPYYKLPKEAQDVYFAFFKCSLHGALIPIFKDINVINNKLTGIELIKYLNIYVEIKDEKSLSGVVNLGKIIFPELIIDGMIYTNMGVNILNFYHQAGFLMNPDHTIEKMPAYFFINKLIETRGKCMFSTLFPSLNSAFLNSIELPFKPAIMHLRGPKLQQKQVKSLKEKGKIPESKLAEMHNWMLKTNSTDIKVLNRNDWNIVLDNTLNNLSNEYAYINYCPRSKSADISIILPTKNCLEFQMKSHQEITFDLINKELAKICILNRLKYTFIIMGLTDPVKDITDTITRLNITTITYSKIEDKILSMIIPAGTVIKESNRTYLKLPDNVECILMYQEGWRNLLGEIAYELLVTKVTKITPALHREKTAEIIKEGLNISNVKTKETQVKDNVSTEKEEVITITTEENKLKNIKRKETDIITTEENNKLKKLKVDEIGEGRG